KRGELFKINLQLIQDKIILCSQLKNHFVSIRYHKYRLSFRFISRFLGCFLHSEESMSYEQA
ncbi:hypothetical protein ACV2HG_24770, partial [Salmonella enterica subsp. enterica serovar Pomona]